MPDKNKIDDLIMPEVSPVLCRDSVSMDSVEMPVDVLHSNEIPRVDLPFIARSTGRYREGRGFSYFREGFDAYCFFVVISGAGEITYRGQTKRMERGDMVFVSSKLPGQTRSLTDDWRFCFVNMVGDSCELFEKLWNEGGLTVIRPRDIAYYTELLERVTEELPKADFVGDLTINLLLTELLTQALKEKLKDSEQSTQPTYPAWVQKTVAILTEKCAEEVRISELATRFYMEQNSFSRRFKKYIGKTPKEYQMDRRMERAKSLLAGSNLSLSEIATRCGFGSHSFFSKVFRQLYGITPTEYRLGLSKNIH